MRLHGAVVVITGASSGIGAATALAFARRGARLELGARRLEKLNTVAEKCRKAGSNNAGVGWMGRAHEMPEEKVDELIATNLKGVINTTNSALPWMLERRRGVIINVASVVGFRPSPYSAVYSATKHAVVGFSHALRGELSGTGVKVCVVYPGVTGGTEFFKAPDQPIGFQYPAWWVANLVVRTARYPRRDAMVFPLRLADVAEPVFGGLMDHAIGEVRRRSVPD
ncbi:MAG: SDR family NAD(P)-dependent oxidoreductase [Chloroflexi bacterium]|nr:MAG: SDR family NAD(P)-dependent oxidoreductase [Chloroflexota bacterium]